MKTLQDIKKQNEAIITIASTGDYNNRQLVVDENIHSDDLGEILEYTLHRMVNANFSPEEICSNSGFLIPTPEELQELEEYGEFSHIDLGYVLGGLITSIKY